MIRSKIRKIPIGAKSAVVYTVASVFSKGLAIITVPIFTRIMTTAEIGTVNLYNSWHSMINVVVTLSLTSGGYIAALKKFEKEREEYQSSVLALTTIMAAGLAIVYAIKPSFWNHITGLSTSLMILMLISFFVAPAYEFWLARQRYEYKYKLAGILTIGIATIGSALAVLVVLNLNKVGSNRIAEGRLYATNIVPIVVSLVLCVILFARGKTFFNKKFWQYSLSLSIPLIGYAFANQVLSVSDRMMISKMIGNSEVGIYSTLYTVSSISLLVWGAINSSFVPYLYQNIDKDNSKTKSLSLMLMGTYAIVAISLTFLAPEIVKILATKEYYEAIYIMPPIAAGVFLTSVSNMYSNILIYYGKTKYIMYSAIIAATTNVVLNFVFISIFGYKAAAYTTLVAYIFLAGFQAVWAKKYCEKDVYDSKKVLYMSIVTILITLTGLIWYQHTIIRYLLIVIGVILGSFLGTKAIKMRRKGNEGEV